MKGKNIPARSWGQRAAVEKHAGNGKEAAVRVAEEVAEVAADWQIFKIWIYKMRVARTSQRLVVGPSEGHATYS